MFNCLYIFNGLLWILISLTYMECTCNLPTEWDGTWYDSNRGDVVFDHNNGQITSGWRVDSYTSSVTSFTCVTESSGYYLFKGDTFVKLFSNDYEAFLCMKYTKITDYSYYYYVYADEEPNANNERAYIELYDASITSYPINSYCNPSTVPSIEEFHVLVKSGNETSIKQWFPNPLLGNFYYTYNDGSTNYCGSNSIWDDCTNRTEAVFNYTLCSTNVLFSTDGLLYCAIYFSSGSTYYVSVLNTDSTVTNPTTYRFTCMAVTQSGSTVYVSTNPGSCVQGQTSTVKTTNGGTAVLTPYFTCPFGSEETASAGTSIIPIVAAVIVVLMLLSIFILGCFLYKKYKKNKDESRVRNSDIEKKFPEKNGRIKENTKVQPQPCDSHVHTLHTYNEEQFIRSMKETDAMSNCLERFKFDSDMIVEPMSGRDALSVDIPDDGERALTPLNSAPIPAPPATPMSQAIRARIPEMQQEQPSLPPISKE